MAALGLLVIVLMLRQAGCSPAPGRGRCERRDEARPGRRAGCRHRRRFLSIKLGTFRDYQIAEIAAYTTAVAGLTVLTGLSGQISLGHARSWPSARTRRRADACT